MPQTNAEEKMKPPLPGDLPAAVSLGFDLLSKDLEPGASMGQVLKLLVKGLQCSRAFIFDFTCQLEGLSPGRKSTVHSLVPYQWPQNLDRPPWFNSPSTDRLLPLWLGRLAPYKDRAIAIDDVAALPQKLVQEKRVLLDTEVKALLLIPIWQQDTLLGLLGFDSTDTPRPWQQHEIMLLAVLTPAVAQVLGPPASYRLTDTRQTFRAWLDSLEDGYFEVDLAGRLTLCNKSLARILGLTKKELQGMHFARYMKKEDARRVMNIFREISGTGEAVRSVEFAIVDSAGQRVQIETSVSPIIGPQGVSVGFRGIVQDITKRKEAETAIRRLAFRDNLTGLRNRVAFEAKLERAVRQSRRTDSGLAVLFIDLDQFKLINDALGHAAGDECLQDVAQRLKRSLRAGDVVARFGGDEFVILLHDTASREEILQVVRRVANSIAEPWSYGGYEFHLTVSIGIAIYPEDGQEASTLLSKADSAMYQAKEDADVSSYRFITPTQTASAYERMMREKRLRQALKNGELVLHYQPKVRLDDGVITGVEALLRWQDPHRGLILPGAFLPLAERTGFIVDINDWILHTVCRQAKKLETAGLTPVRLAVNLSETQLLRGDLPQTVQQMLRDYKLDPAWLEFELAENIAMQDVKLAGAVLTELRHLGAATTLDNLGTGSCSLAQLRQLPVGCLKLDQAFTAHIGQPAPPATPSPHQVGWGQPEVLRQTGDPADPRARTAYSAAVVRAMAVLGRSLGLTVLAEGTETEQQALFLKHAGVHEIQGHFFSGPLSAQKLLPLLGQPPRPLLPTDPPTVSGPA